MPHPGGTVHLASAPSRVRVRTPPGRRVRPRRRSGWAPGAVRLVSDRSWPTAPGPPTPRPPDRGGDRLLDGQIRTGGGAGVERSGHRGVTGGPSPAAGCPLHRRPAVPLASCPGGPRGAVMVDQLQEWQSDPSGKHRFRLHADGRPTDWVSDGTTVVHDPLPPAQAYPASPRPARSPRRPSRSPRRAGGAGADQRTGPAGRLVPKCGQSQRGPVLGRIGVDHLAGGAVRRPVAHQRPGRPRWGRPPPDPGTVTATSAPQPGRPPPARRPTGTPTPPTGPDSGTGTGSAGPSRSSTRRPLPGSARGLPPDRTLS